jgi:hypothetical protein
VSSTVEQVPRTSGLSTSTPPGAAAGTSARWRRVTPWLLIVLAAVIALVSALNVWVKRQALSTESWTNASAQLLENDDIRNALSVYTVNQLYGRVDVGQALEQRLPPATKPLADPLATALQPALVRATDTMLERPRSQQLWENANRRAHTLLMAVIDGKHGILESTNGEVILNMRPLVQELATETGIGGRVAERLPPDAGEIVVMKGNQLEVARRTVKAIRALSYLLSFAVLALFAAAVYIARGRRRTTLMGVGVSMLVVGLLVLVARRLGGTYLVDALTSDPESKRPVEAAWGIETALLRDVGINVVVYGGLTVLAAWLAGPSRPAVALRRLAAPTMRDRPAIVYGLVALVLLVLLLTGPTDGQRIYPLLVLFGLAFLGTEVLRRQTRREFPAAEPSAST